MPENCFVIERIEWDEKLDEKRVPYDRYEYHELCRVCRNLEDAVAFTVKNVGRDPYDMTWKGKWMYSGSLEDEHDREGVIYIIHRLPLY